MFLVITRGFSFFLNLQPHLPCAERDSMNVFKITFEQGALKVWRKMREIYLSRSYKEIMIFKSGINLTSMLIYAFVYGSLSKSCWVGSASLFL